MTPNEDSLQTLNHIRDLMERSSKFLSLSGLSGVFAGLFALIGAGAAYIRYKTQWMSDILEPLVPYQESERSKLISFLILDGALVVLFSLAAGIFFTVRRAKKNGLQVWNSSSKRLLASLMIPLVTGGIFCLAMLYYGYIWLVFPVTLLFYGLAIVSASRFTFPEVFYLGVTEIVLGCFCLFLTGYSLLFWSLGFGVVHIVYGLAMYNRYERTKAGATSRTAGMSVVAILLFSAGAMAQTPSTDAANQTRQWYQKEAIYLQGANKYVKNNMEYIGVKALKQEFVISEGGMQLYIKSRRLRALGMAISLTGSVGTIASLISGNRNMSRTFFWVSLGTGLVGSAVTMGSNNLRDQAVWLRNRDAILLMEANQ